MKNWFLFCIFFAGILFFGFGLQGASAYTIEKLNFSDQGDIVVGPGKTELSLSPGETSNQEIIVSNRSGSPKIINISVEDFQGTKDPNETIQFLGDNRGPYSLKDYVKPEVSQVTLNFGERLRLPVSISIPNTAAPGGLYGAVMVSASNVDQGNGETPNDSAAGKVKIITQVASLFFITVKGDVIQNGELKDFKPEKNFYEQGPITFKIISENNGSIYLSPFGSIEIKNIIGQKIGEKEIEPWFVLPGSVRERDVLWNSNFLFGRYTATVFINRGYQNIVDQKFFSFWVIPWKTLSMILIGLILVVWFFIWIFMWFAKHLRWQTPANPANPTIP